MNKSESVKATQYQSILPSDRESPLTFGDQENKDPNETIGLGFRAKKIQGRMRKILRTSIAIASICFFISVFLGWYTFGRDDYYTVSRGDDLTQIAKKFNVPVNVLMNMNEIKSRFDIKEGLRIKIPTEYDAHVVKGEEKLYDIAKKYGVKHYDLTRYNKFVDSTRLKNGDVIFIPRKLSDITITVNKTMGLVPFKANLSVVTNTRDLIKNFHWDMGNGDESQSQNPIYTYNDKGIYKVTLTVSLRDSQAPEDDDRNSEENKVTTIVSNTINIDVRKLEKIQFNAPQYIEVYNKGDVISLEAKAIDNLGEPVEFNYKCKIKGNPQLIAQVDKTDKFQIIGTGYSAITIEAEGYSHTGYYFVSPIPSVQVTRNNTDWYKTQFQTGINGNCGPACASMAIGWAKGLNIPVSRIREYIGLPNPDGGIGYYSIQSALDNYGVKTHFVSVATPEEIFPIIDRGHIAIILLDRGSVEIGENYKINLFGRYYNDAGGHYIIVKGYSKDKKYFVVYDPIPADWWMNSFRYDDGISMIGKNRYYLVKNVWATLSRGVIEVLND